jgi:1,4-alpha-glucan branching enzyme
MKALFIDRAGAQAIWGLMESIALALQKRGDDVLFCLWDSGQNRTDSFHPDIPALRVAVPPKNAKWDVLKQHSVFYKTFGELLRQEQPDVVHTNFCIPGSMARYQACRHKVPLVVSTQHEVYHSMNPVLRTSVRLTERCADVVTYVSKTVADSFGRLNQVKNGSKDTFDTRHRVIYNGVDVPHIQALSLGYKQHGKQPRIICVGRMMREKGQHTLIRALPAVLRYEPYLKLELVGSGPEEKRLKALAAQLNVEDHINFTGWIEKKAVIKKIAASDLLVSASTHEGFGLVVAEAMAAGTPALASDIPVFREVIGDESCGGFFKADDPDSLAAEIKKMRINPCQVEQRRKNASKRVFDMFSHEKMVDQYLSIYDEQSNKVAQ